MDIEDFGIPRDPVIEHYKKDVDRTLIRENLKLSVEERLVKLQEHLEFADADLLAGGEFEGDGAGLPGVVGPCGDPVAGGGHRVEAVGLAL